MWFAIVVACRSHLLCVCVWWVSSSSSASDTPQKCYNTPKSYKFGWYASRHVEWVAGSSQFNGNLIGVGDVGNTNVIAADRVLVRIGTAGNDYYVGFNRKSGINIGTGEAEDQVTIHTRAAGTAYEYSYLVAKLSAGQSYSFTVGGATTVVEVGAIDLAGLLGRAFVRVCANTCAQTPTAAPPPTAPTPPPTVPSFPVTFGSAWSYLSDGTNPGTAWRGSSFDDSGWLAGTGQFGFGDGDETTVLTRQIAFYFRKRVLLAAPAPMTVTLLFDDGAVVYVNGFEVRGRS